MDIYCSICGEPWEMDTLHEAAEEQDITFSEMHNKFKAEGCKALMWGSKHCVPQKSMRTTAQQTMNELLGDDVDGIASMMDDFDSLGILEE